MEQRRVLPDLIIFVAALALLGIGLVMVSSASSVMALREVGDPHFYLKRQLIGVLVGVVAMILVMRIDYRSYRAFAIPGVLVACALLGLVLVVGQEIAGSKRWINLGLVNLQPSEIAKLAMINFVAAYGAHKKAELQRFFSGLCPPLFVAGLIFGLIMLEPDFGTGVAVLVTVVVMLYVAGSRTAHLVGLGSLGFPMLALLVWLEPYRMRRIFAFIDPMADPLGAGWNVIQSMLAVGSGGLFGLGLGMGRQKYAYLPEQHTDFIFAILSEELGYLGAATVVILFFVIAWRGYRAALNAPDMFGCLLGVGVTTMITFQAMLNMGVVTGSLPVTGITLPFISFGSSSLVITLAGIGIILNISAGRGRAG